MPFVIDLAAAGLGGGLGAAAGIAQAQRQDVQTNMQLHQMQQQAQQQAWERDFRTRQAQQQAIETQRSQQLQYRNQQLQALRDQQGFGLKQQQATDTNTRAANANQTRLTLAQIAQQTANDKMQMQDAQFEQTFGLKKADYDADQVIAQKKLAQGDQRIKQAYDLAQQRLQAGQDSRAVQRDLNLAIRAANAADSAAKANVSEGHRAWSQSHQAAVDEYNALIAKPPSSLTPAEKQRMMQLPTLIAVPSPAVQTITPTPVQVPATQPAGKPAAAAKPAVQSTVYGQGAPLPVADKIYRRENLTNAELKQLFDSLGGDPETVVGYLRANGYDDKGNRNMGQASQATSDPNMSPAEYRAANPMPASFQPDYYAYDARWTARRELTSDDLRYAQELMESRGRSMGNKAMMEPGSGEYLLKGTYKYTADDIRKAKGK